MRRVIAGLFALICRCRPCARGRMGFRSAQVHPRPGHQPASAGDSAVLREVPRRRSSSTPSTLTCGATSVSTRTNRRGTSSTWTRTARRHSSSCRETSTRPSNATGREFVNKNGLLPWRTQEIHVKLVEAFTQKATFSRDNIKYFSAFLGHYLSDAQVPFHAALNHDGQLTGQWGIHSRFETETFERYRGRLDVKPKPIVTVKSARDFAFDSLVTSFSHVQADP